MKLPEDRQPPSATRYYLVLLPRLGYTFGPERSAWFDATLSRDTYDPSSEADETERRYIEDEEIAFAQIVGRYEQRSDDGDRWRAGLGYSRLTQGEPHPDRWRRLRQQDRFVEAAYRLALGKTDWAEFLLEARSQEVTYTVDLPDYDETATVGTVGGRYETTFGAYQGGLRMNYARFNALGRYARKTLLDGALHLARSWNLLKADLGWYAVEERFIEPSPALGGAALRQILRTWTLNLIQPLSQWFTLSEQVRQDDRSSNNAQAEYRNTALNISLIYIY